MADREVGRSTTISADLPGSEDKTVTLTLVDPVGQVTVTERATTAVVGIRRTASVDANEIFRSGTWLALWDVDNRQTVQPFTVGPASPAGLTKFDLRTQVAQRVEQVVVSEVTSAQPDIITDDTLIGGAGNYRLWYLLPSPGHVEAGLVKRVKDYSGSGLVLSRAFETLPEPGELYVLLRVDPREVDRALRTAFADLSTMGRIHVTVPDVPVVDGVLTAPRGLTHIYEVWNDTTLLTPLEWTQRSGRFFDIIPSFTAANVVGLRHAAFPVWEDSVIDLEPAALIARAAQMLHAMRAGGAGTDANEHLRRQLAAQAEYEGSRRLAAGRMPHGVREVIS